VTISPSKEEFLEAFKKILIDGKNSIKKL